MNVLVTGGGRGIGRATARALAEFGAHVIVSSRTESELAGTVDAIHTDGGIAAAVTADLALTSECERLVGKVLGEHGSVDVLVHCAGFTPSAGPFEGTSVEDFQRAMDTNARSLFCLARLLVPRMRDSGRGMIVAMSSGCGLKGHPNLAAYSSSKFAVQGLVQAMARELEGTPVTAVCVNPGGVDTRMLADLFGKEEAARNQSPEVVAAVVLQIVDGALSVPSGGGVTVRRGEVEVYAAPGPGRS
jgi:dehydrogenase/reductase SDR family member 4